MSRWADVRAAALSAALYQLAFPPFHLAVPSFVCLTPVLIRLMVTDRDRHPARRQLFLGLTFGLLVYGLGLNWMGVALWRMRPQWSGAYVAVVLGLASCMALLFALAGCVRRTTHLSPVLIVPALWTAFEFIMGHLGALSFPWLGLGTSLTAFPMLVQIADVVGARGVTFLLAAANATLATAWLERRRWQAIIRRLAPIAAGTILALGYGELRSGTVALEHGLNVAAVQPSIEPLKKWDPRYGEHVMDVLAHLSLEASRLPGLDLIAWPETAVPGSIQSRPRWTFAVAEHARRSGVPVLVGALDEMRNGSSARYYNAAFLFDGINPWTVHPVYHKRHPVPLVERTPAFMRWAASGRLPPIQAGGNGSLYSVAGRSFGVLICYEAAFEDLARAYRHRGADFLVNLSNDAWFGNGLAPYQHASHLVMRAIENRVGIVRAANTGFSELIDPLGRVSRRSALNQQTVVAGEVLITRDRSVYASVGDWVGVLSVVIAATLSLAAMPGLWAARSSQP